MQKNFVLRAKRVVKGIAAVAIGAAMLGATLSSALAADPTLASYPGPFTGANSAIIIGSSADSAAASDIALGLPKAASSTNPSTPSQGQVQQAIPLGMGISNSTASAFDWEFGQNYISSFQKGQVNFNNKNYHVHDELDLAKDSPNTATSLSSKTAIQTDYEANPFLEVAGRDKIGYYYVFDDAINISQVTSTNPLQISFLGKTLKITSVDSTDANSGTFTAYITNEYFMNVGDTVTVNGKKVKLENVGSTGAILASVDGVIDTVSSSNAKVINGIQIAVDQTFYDSNNKNQRAATLFVGSQAVNTYKNGDPYIGEDPNNPNWVWDTTNLDNNTGTTVSQTTPGTLAINGPRLGIFNNFLAQSSSQNPPGIGQCINLPNNYASICLDSVNVQSNDYLTVTQDLGRSYYTAQSGQNFSSTAQNVIEFQAPGSARFVIHGGSFGSTIYGPAGADNFIPFNATNGDIHTSKIWIASLGNAPSITLPNQSTIAAQNATAFVEYYWDPTKNPELQTAGIIELNLTLTNFSAGLGGTTQANSANNESLNESGQVPLFQVTFGNTKNTNVNVSIARMDAVIGATNTSIGIFWQENANSNNLIENNGDIIFTNWTLGVANGNFSSLGVSASIAEPGELAYGPGILNIGYQNVDLRTRYGTIIKDPQVNGASDQVVLAVPDGEVEANVIIKGTAVSSLASGPSTTTSSTTMTADQVSDVTKYNAILVGGPCANPLTAKVLGASTSWPDCANGFTPGQAVLQLKANGSNWALIAAGYSADDTRRAGIVLREAGSGTSTAGFLSTNNGKLPPNTSVVVKGTTLDVSGITIA